MQNMNMSSTPDVNTSLCQECFQSMKMNSWHLQHFILFPIYPRGRHLLLLRVWSSTLILIYVLKLASSGEDEYCMYPHSLLESEHFAIVDEVSIVVTFYFVTV